jgi:signal transduction histidine kinase
MPVTSSAAGGRRAVALSLIAPALWLAGMSIYALTYPDGSAEFRSHVIEGLGILAAVVLGPLLLVLLTLNWIVRRIAALFVTVLFVGMAVIALGQGFGWAVDAGIVALCAILLGATMFFLSRPAVLSATGDSYNFLSPRDVFSLDSFRRKRAGAASEPA